MDLTPTALAKMIDHTLLKPEATKNQVKTLVDEALREYFRAVCVAPYMVETAKDALRHAGRYAGTPTEAERDNAKIMVASVIGFPHGNGATRAKIEEAKQALVDGASEFDVVMNYGAFLSHDYHHCSDEVRQLVQALRPYPVKLILETCYLTREQVETASRMAVDNGVACIKTSTGFGSEGADPAIVRLMRTVADSREGGNAVKVKASGGIKTLDHVKAMIDAGADILGMSSGVDVVAELREEIHDANRTVIDRLQGECVQK